MSNVQAYREIKSNIFESKEPLLSPGLRYESIGHAILDKLDKYADLTLIIDVVTGQEWTGRQIKQIIMSVAACLLENFADKFNYGDMVCIFYKHSVQSIFLSLGVICAGGSVFTEDEALTYNEVLNNARRLRFKFWFSYERRLDYKEKLEADLGYEIVAISMDGPVKAGKLFSVLSDFINYEYDTKANKLNLPVACKDKFKDVAFLCCSSGTTGVPKNVPCTHGNVLSYFRDQPNTNYNSKTVAGTAPFDYISGRISIMGVFELGYKLAVLAYQNIEDIFKLIDKYKVTYVLLGMSSLYSFVTTYKHYSKIYDISSLNVLYLGGAKLTFLDKLKEFLKDNPNIVHVSSAYGTSEGEIVAKRQRSPEDFFANPSSCGFLVPGVQMKLLDVSAKQNENREELVGINKHGLIYFKSPSLFPGYYDATIESETHPFIRGSDIFDADGFFNTGDIGYMDEKNELYIVGRFKETMVCRTGLKVLPDEIEIHIRSHPVVSEACVLGFEKSTNAGQHYPRGYVVLNKSVYDDPKNFVPLYSLDNDKDSDTESSKVVKSLTRRGTHQLCSLDTELRHAIEVDIALHLSKQLSSAKQLIGGLVILDKIPLLRNTGKLNKSYLRALNESQIEIFGELPK